MSWKSGARVLQEVWHVTRDKVPEHLRVDLLVSLMDVFAKHDCDTIMDIICPEWPEAVKAFEKWEAADQAKQ